MDTILPRAQRPRVVATVVVASILVCATNGFILGGLTIFDSRIIADLHVSNGALRLRDTITVATLGLSVPVTGHLLDRYPVRPVLLIGLLAMVVGFAAYARVASIWQVYALHVLFGVTQATSGVVSCVYLVSSLTGRHRGLALGVLMAGSGLGNAVIPMLNQWLVSHLAWRQAVLSGCFAAALLVPMVMLVVQEPRRSSAYGEAPGDPGGGRAPSVGPALRSREFLLLAAIAGTTCFAVLALTTNLALYAASDGGQAAGSAALLLFSLFGAAVAAQLASGAATYRLGAGSIHLAAVSLMLVGALGFTLVPPALAAAAVMLFGLGWGANATMLQVRPATLFAGPALGRMLSVLAVVETFAGASGPSIAGRVSDRAGSFQPVFALLALTLTVSVVAALLLRSSGPARQAASP